MNYYCKQCGSLETAPSAEKIIELGKLCLKCKSNNEAFYDGYKGEVHE